MKSGDTFGQYRLGRLLGRGGFGEVFEATDTEKGRLVALKVIAAPYSRDPMFRQRLFREASSAGRLHEPHVVPIHSFGEIDDQLYIDMRLIEGVNLQALLTGAGALEPARAVWLVGQVGAALDAAHEAGMVHRDVKPANVLVTGDDFAYLVDFGVASAASETKLTSTGTTVGTLAYMAPERFGGSVSVDRRADVYALACVLFECLTGAPPFAGDLAALMGAHLYAPIPRPSAVGRHIPPGLDAVIEKGMAKDPAHRFSSAGELVRAAQVALTAGDAAQTVAAQVPPAPAPAVAMPVAPAPVRRTARVAVVAVSVLVVAVLAIAAGVLIYTKRSGNADHRAADPTQASEVVTPPENPRQSVLPFTGLKTAWGVAVDKAGAVYVVDQNTNRVVMLPAGASAQTELPLDLRTPNGVAVDGAGNVYVTDFDSVVMLAPGATKQTEMPPFPVDVKNPNGVAADAEGNVYITANAGYPVDDALHPRALRLAKGSTEWTELPITGLRFPRGIAVGVDGAVFVADDSENKVWKLPAGAAGPVELPFTGLKGPRGVAVDGKGDVYVVDMASYRVLQLPVGSSTQSELPLTRLGAFPFEYNYIAVDSAGNVYVSGSTAMASGDAGVLKLAAA